MYLHSYIYIYIYIYIYNYHNICPLRQMTQHLSLQERSNHSKLLYVAWSDFYKTLMVLLTYHFDDKLVNNYL